MYHLFSSEVTAGTEAAALQAARAAGRVLSHVGLTNRVPPTASRYKKESGS